MIDRSKFKEVSDVALERLARIQHLVKQAKFKKGDKDSFITISPHEHLVANTLKDLKEWLKEQTPELFVKRVKMSEAEKEAAGIKKKTPAYFVGIGTSAKAAEEGACAVDDDEEDDEAADEEKGGQEEDEEEDEEVVPVPPTKKAKKGAT